MSFLPVNIAESRGRAFSVATPGTALSVVEHHQLEHVEGTHTHDQHWMYPHVAASNVRQRYLYEMAG